MVWDDEVLLDGLPISYTETGFSEEHPGLTGVAAALELPKFLASCTEKLRLDGILLGPGIKSNNEQLTEPKWLIVDVWVLSFKNYLSTERKEGLLKHAGLPYLATAGQVNVEDWTLSLVSFLKDLAKGPSWNPNSPRYGIILKKDNSRIRVYSENYGEWFVKD
jgi:hypothetical protein